MSSTHCGYEFTFRLTVCFENDVLKNLHLPEMQETVAGVNCRVRKLYCFTVHFDSLNLIPTNQRTSPYKDVLVF
jgi:hypothetical protein